MTDTTIAGEKIGMPRQTRLDFSLRARTQQSDQGKDTLVEHGVRGKRLLCNSRGTILYVKRFPCKYSK